jgi:hypothetical protein
MAVLGVEGLDEGLHGGYTGLLVHGAVLTRMLIGWLILVAL